MDADVCGEIDIFRLVEVADKVARLKYCTQHRGRISRIDAEITVAQVVRREERRSSGQIKDDVAARSQAVTGSLEDKRVARGGAGRGVVIDSELERAQMSLGVADCSLDDWERTYRLRRYLHRLCNHDRHVEMIGEQPSSFDGNFVAAVDQDNGLACQRDKSKTSRWIRGSREH